MRAALRVTVRPAATVDVHEHGRGRGRSSGRTRSSVTPSEYSIPCSSATPGGVGTGRPTSAAAPRVRGTLRPPGAGVRERHGGCARQMRKQCERDRQQQRTDEPGGVVRAVQQHAPGEDDAVTRARNGAVSVTTIAGSQPGEYRRVGSPTGFAAFHVAVSPRSPPNRSRIAASVDTGPRLRADPRTPWVGSPRVNRLADETSPYLRQHRDNPVDWYPWGDEAFAAARERNVPDPALGRLLGLPLVPRDGARVLRGRRGRRGDERSCSSTSRSTARNDPTSTRSTWTPCRRMTGRGGWPMTVFLSPTAQPFYGGTYFPKPTVPAADRRDRRRVAQPPRRRRAERRRRSIDGDRPQRRDRARRPTCPGIDVLNAALQPARRQRSTPSGAGSARRRSSRRR